MRFGCTGAAKGFRKLRTSLFFLLVLLSYLPAVYAGTVYVDSWNGNDRNSGLSPSTAWRTALPSKPGDQIVTLRSREPVRNAGKPLSTPFSAAVGEGSGMERILLGAERVSDWVSSAPGIWKAPLEISYLRLSIKRDGVTLSQGCAADFLNDHDWSLQSGYLYLRDEEGNPDLTGRSIVAEYLDSSHVLQTLPVTGWQATTESVFQAGLATGPIHLVLDGSFYGDWWWGPLSCFTVSTGESDTLYLRTPDGNPDVAGKEVYAVTRSGGWTVISGDFNGDGLKDVAHSNGAGVFVNYGQNSFQPIPAATLTDSGGQPVAAFEAASAGDVNGDGFDDLLVFLGYGAGDAYLYMGSAAGLSDAPDVVLSLPGSAAGVRFEGPRRAGDFNHDGYSDIAIAAPSGILLYYGSGSGIPSVPDATLSSPDITLSYPLYAGNIDGDVYADLAVAATGTAPGSAQKIRIYHGSSTGIAAGSFQELEFSVSWTNFTFTDLNGDGLPDLVLTNELADGEFSLEGAAYVFYQSAGGGFPSVPGIVLSNPLPEENVRFGAAVEAVGDFNYDGFNDVAVGCPYPSIGGYVAVYYGSAVGVAGQPSLVLRKESGASGATGTTGTTGTTGATGTSGAVSATSTWDKFGWSISRAGDITGDGRNFIMVGEEYGASYLFALDKPPAPVADFTASPVSGSAPLQVTFTDGSTGTVTGRLWNFGDGNTSTVRNPVHTYSVIGAYTVSLTVTGPTGTGSVSKSEYINVFCESGSIRVVLSPDTANAQGARWKISGNESWHESGETVPGIEAGQHTLEFKAIEGWEAPASQNVTILNHQTVVVTPPSYVCETGGLRVTLGPAAAVTAGAQWRLDGGSWRNSGETVSNLAPGDHQVEFKDITGWDKPVDQTVTTQSGGVISTATGAYVAWTGSLQVTISPAGAVSAGAQWRLDGGAWRNSGETVSDLPLGDHVVQFKDLTWWDRPAAEQSVTVQHDETASISPVYTEVIRYLRITISPGGAVAAGAQWQVDGGAWLNSGERITNLPAGTHTVRFRDIAGWKKPADQVISVAETGAASGFFAYVFDFSAIRWLLLLD